MSAYRIGIDLGGTKIEIAVMAPDGRLVFTQRVPTPKTYPDALEAIAGLVTEAEATVGERATVGIGVPGRVDPATGMLRSSTALTGHRFGPDISARLGREVRVANDAGCFALSEAMDGAGAGKDVVLGLILGTGVGAGLVVSGRLLGGRNGLSGEWGHAQFAFGPGEEGAGFPCWCGRTGCNETALAGPALARLCDGPAARDAHLVPSRAAAGDAAAQRALEVHADRLARGLTDLVNTLDPDVIVLGGGLSNLVHLYAEMPERMRRIALMPYAATPVVKNVHGDSSGVRGAAWLWPG